MSKWTFFPLIWALTCFLWLAGGQCWLWARRYVLSVLMAGYAYFANREANKRRFALVFLSLIGLLSMGYGENSWLRKALGGSETWTRAFMACLIASVFVTYLCLTHGNVWQIPTVYALNIGAWQIRAGSLAKIGKYDILIEDLFRATSLSASFFLV